MNAITMEYHLVASRPLDLSRLEEDAAVGAAPRSSMAAIVRDLGARVHDGAGLRLSLADRVAGRLTGSRPTWWAIARSVRRAVKPGDVIYCTGEDVGMPTAALCAGRGARLAVLVHRGDSPKKVLAFRALNLRRKVDLFLAVSQVQVRHLRTNLRLPPEQARFVWDQTDTDYFSPGPRSAEAPPRLIVSVGLEMRDYVTLAEATGGRDVAVRISAFSVDTREARRALPDELPSNMQQRFYPWPEFVQLYRDSAAVVVTLHPNSYAAGVQALMEGLACGRPVVATRTEGLTEYLAEVPAVRVVPSGDAEGLWSAIEESLASDSVDEEARAAALRRHRLEDQVATIAGALRELAARPIAKA